MKKLLLALSLLMPVVAVADVNWKTMVEEDRQEYLQELQLKGLREVARKEREAKQAPVVEQGRFTRAIKAVKSAGSRGVTAVKSAGAYVAGRAKGLGLYGLSKAQAVKGLVAAEYAKAQGVKGVSLFAAKALLGTSLTVAAGYLAYKGIQYAYSKAKTVTKKSTKKKKKIAVRPVGRRAAA